METIVTIKRDKMENLKWIQVSNNVKTFKLGEEPELIHIIKTGFKDKYMVVDEDAYEQYLGRVTFGTKKEIEERYKIKL